MSISHLDTLREMAASHVVVSRATEAQSEKIVSPRRALVQNDIAWFSRAALISEQLSDLKKGDMISP